MDERNERLPVVLKKDNNIYGFFFIVVVGNDATWLPSPTHDQGKENGVTSDRYNGMGMGMGMVSHDSGMKGTIQS